MATPGKDIAPFLQGNPAANASSGGKAQPPYESRPQKSGSSSDDYNSSDKHRGPDRAQPMRKPDTGAGDSPTSIPAGGPLPYSSPSKPTQTPFKLGK